MAKLITRTVWMLSLVSLFADFASEMLYPVMPIYLQSIGFSVMLIGVLEGFAEATAGLSKGYFGKLSDATGKRLPFVRWGYLLSACSKPLMAVFTFPAWIFLARTTDRLGKGIRTAARDALLSDEATKETKGTVFGFHRSMDTVGAFIGPVVALAFLYFYPGSYRLLFFVAFLPGLASIVLTLLIKEKRKLSLQPVKKTSFFSFISYFRTGPLAYRKLAIGLLLFALFNSSDIFLLLKLKEANMGDTATIGFYIFYNLCFAVLAYPVGILADKIGLKNILIAGIIVFALVYFGMAANTSFYGFLLLFFLYGLYAAATEGIGKALITNISRKEDTATAIGAFTAFQSICALIASSVAGILWFQFGSATAFMATGVVSAGIAIYLLLIRKTIQPSAV